jgi:hypothetical protein
MDQIKRERERERNTERRTLYVQNAIIKEGICAKVKENQGKYSLVNKEKKKSEKSKGNWPERMKELGNKESNNKNNVARFFPSKT